MVENGDLVEPPVPRVRVVGSWPGAVLVHFATDTQTLANRLASDAVIGSSTDLDAVAVEVQNGAIGHEGHVLPLTSRQRLAAFPNSHYFAILLMYLHRQFESIADSEAELSDLLGSGRGIPVGNDPTHGSSMTGQTQAETESCPLSALG